MQAIPSPDRLQAGSYLQPTDAVVHFMKSKLLLLALALGAALFTAGCDTIGEPLNERFAPPPVKRVVEAPAARVFVAAKEALVAMGYRISAASAKSGRLEAYGRLRIDDGFTASTQHNCQVTIVALPDGACDVQLEVREQMEERTGAGAMRLSEQVLPWGGVHERFFGEVQARVASAPTGATE